MRRGLTDVNEKTFDIDKFDFETAYFRQGFTAAMLALGVRGEDADNNLSLQHNARVHCPVLRKCTSHGSSGF